MRHNNRKILGKPDGGSSGIAGPYAHLLKLIDPEDPAYTDIVRAIAANAVALVALGEEIDDEVVTTSIRVGRANYQLSLQQEQRPDVPRRPTHRPAQGRNVVYYVRRSELVKIGTTMRLRERMRAIRPDEILAVEPGSFDLEAYRHRQFRHLRLRNSEYFRQDDDLKQHIAKVREKHGDPDPTLLTFPKMPRQR